MTEMTVWFSFVMFISLFEQDESELCKMDEVSLMYNIMFFIIVCEIHVNYSATRYQSKNNNHLITLIYRSLKYSFQIATRTSTKVPLCLLVLAYNQRQT